MARSELRQTCIVTALASVVSGSVAYRVQAKANEVVASCSYLDPITVDILALFIGAFLIGEGFVDIFAHRESRVRSQLGRVARVAVGASVMVIHIMQLIHK